MDTKLEVLMIQLREVKFRIFDLPIREIDSYQRGFLDGLALAIAKAEEWAEADQEQAKALLAMLSR